MNKINKLVLLAKVKKIFLTSFLIILCLFLIIIFFGIFLTKREVENISTSVQPTSSSKNEVSTQKLVLASTSLKANEITNIKSKYSSKYKNATYTEEKFISDGISTILTLQDQYDDVEIKKDGNLILLGILPDSCPDNYDSCYDYSGKKIIFKVAPKRGAVITFTGASSIAQKQTWKTSHSWKGNDLKTTESFQISESPWKFKWSSSGSQLPIFQVYLIDVYTGKTVEVIANSKTGSGENYVYHSGNFYLKINPANVYWTAEVQELSGI